MAGTGRCEPAGPVRAGKSNIAVSAASHGAFDSYMRRGRLMQGTKNCWQRAGQRRETAAVKAVEVCSEAEWQNYGCRWKSSKQ